MLRQGLAPDRNDTPEKLNCVRPIQVWRSFSVKLKMKWPVSGQQQSLMGDWRRYGISPATD